MTPATHLGRKISRLRELRGMKQETLAEALGMSQQAMSKIELSESVEDVMIERVGKVLGLSPAAIKSFNEDALLVHIENMTNHNSDQASGVSNYPSFNFNPIDKLMEVIEENKKLYERLLAAEQEKNELLKKMLDKK